MVIINFYSIPNFFPFVFLGSSPYLYQITLHRNVCKSAAAENKTLMHIGISLMVYSLLVQSFFSFNIKHWPYIGCFNSTLAVLTVI